MRHGKKFNHLSRTSSHRKAMMANMASSLIKHKRIKTTLAKAKALRGYVEPLITKSKDDSTHSRRVVFSYLQDKEAVTELFREISVKVADRPGGYTRILKLGPRLGDNAEMCLIELVDYNENLLSEKAAKPKRARRRRGGGKSEEVKSQSAEVEESAEVKAQSEEVKEEEPKGEEISEKREEKEEVKKEVKKEEPKEEVKAQKEEVKEEPKEKKDKS